MYPSGALNIIYHIGEKFTIIIVSVRYVSVQYKWKLKVFDHCFPLPHTFLSTFRSTHQIIHPFHKFIICWLPRSPAGAISRGTFSGPCHIARLGRHQLGGRPRGSAIGWWVNRKPISIVCLVTMVTASVDSHACIFYVTLSGVVFCGVSLSCSLCVSVVNWKYINSNVKKINSYIKVTWVAQGTQCNLSPLVVVIVTRS